MVKEVFGRNTIIPNVIVMFSNSVNSFVSFKYKKNWIKNSQKFIEIEIVF